MKLFKIILVWILGFLITIGAAVFQRMTGPTHPYKEKISLNQKDYKLKFTRSLVTNEESIIEIPVNEQDIKGVISYRLYPSHSPFCTDTLEYTSKGLRAYLPKQAAAGKVEYQIQLTDGISIYQTPFLLIRYKDPVPNTILILHIVAMFLGMFLAVVAGLMALTNYRKYVHTFLWSTFLLFVGGVILGPIVQKYAFGEFWTGIPFGWDLTDNKTLVMVLVFAFACYKNYKTPSRLWTIVAVVVMLLVYSIPHSLFGSELNPETGEIIQAGLIGLGCTRDLDGKWKNDSER